MKAVRGALGKFFGGSLPLVGAWLASVQRNLIRPDHTFAAMFDVLDLIPQMPSERLLEMATIQHMTRASFNPSPAAPDGSERATYFSPSPRTGFAATVSNSFVSRPRISPRSWRRFSSASLRSFSSIAFRSSK